MPQWVFIKSLQRTECVHGYHARKDIYVIAIVVSSYAQSLSLFCEQPNGLN